MDLDLGVSQGWTWASIQCTVHIMFRFIADPDVPIVPDSWWVPLQSWSSMEEH